MVAAMRPPRLPALILVPLLLGATTSPLLLLRRGGPGTPPPFARAFAPAPGSTRTASGSGRSRAIAAPGATAPSAPSAAAADAKRATRQEASEEAAWMPPSQNAGQRRGNVFAIRKPEDLLDFVAEDDRLGVVKVYAPWCKTCRSFDLRYRKLASRFGDKHDASKRIAKDGRARFAEMELRDDNEGILRALLPRSRQPISLPYVLLYRGGRMERDFRCTPKTFGALVDAVEEMAAEDPVLVRGGSAGARAGDGGASGANGGGSKRARETNGGTSTTDATATAGEAAMAKGRGLGAAQSYLSTLGTR